MRLFYVLLVAAITSFPTESLSAQTSRGSLAFTTGDQYAEVPVSPMENIGEGDFTFEVWMRGQEDQPARHPTLFSNRSASSGNSGVMLFMHDLWRDSRTKIISLQLNGYNHKYVDNGTFNAGLLTGECQHIAVTKVGGAVNLYVNGQLIGSEGTSVAGSTVASGLPLRIGADRITNQPFEGNLSQLRIWNVARTAEEILATKDLVLTGEEEGLLAYYEMNDGTGQTLTDKVGDFNGILGVATEQEGIDPVWSTEDCVAAPVSAVTPFAPGSVRAYPNPAHGVVTLEHNINEPLNYSFVNGSGQVIRRGLVTAGRTEISLDGLRRGFYILQLTNRTNIFTQKLVIE